MLFCKSVSTDNSLVCIVQDKVLNLHKEQTLLRSIVSLIPKSHEKDSRFCNIGTK